MHAEIRNLLDSAAHGDLDGYRRHVADNRERVQRMLAAEPIALGVPCYRSSGCALTVTTDTCYPVLRSGQAIVGLTVVRRDRRWIDEARPTEISDWYAVHCGRVVTRGHDTPQDAADAAVREIDQ